MSLLLKPLEPRHVALYVIAVIVVLLYLRPRHDRPENDSQSADYQSACEGAPLRTIERRQQAREDGYEINQRYDCIDKSSFRAIAEQRAQWNAAHTPEALAKQEADLKKRALQAQAEREVAAQKEKEQEAADASARMAEFNRVVVLVDVNTASRMELAGIPGVGDDIAAALIAERQKGRFKNWNDLAARYFPFSQAQPAAIASANGLTVNGESLSGVAPDSEMGLKIRTLFPKSGRGH